MKSKLSLILTLFLIVGIMGAAVVTINSSQNVSALSMLGSRGQEVIEIQRKLQNLGFYGGAVDGIYGNQTYTAVRRFQASRGLVVDGIAGTNTLRALGLVPQSAITSRDINLLAHLIYAEARGEPYAGQVAVAACVLNRVKDPRFPKTVAGVIYQPGQYSSVDDGQINLAPNQTAFNAARDALNGWDPSYGSLYFYNPITARSDWLRAKPIVVRIGNHVFCR